MGDGYVAVATAGGFRPLMKGDTAMQEWIPQGRGALYVAILGDKKEYKDFNSFVKKLGEPIFDDKSQSITFKQKSEFSLTWDGPFFVDGKSVTLSNGLPEVPPRLANPATVVSATDSILSAAFGGEKLVIDLIEGKRISPDSQA